MATEHKYPIVILVRFYLLFLKLLPKKSVQATKMKSIPKLRCLLLICEEKNVDESEFQYWGEKKWQIIFDWKQYIAENSVNHIRYYSILKTDVFCCWKEWKTTDE